MIRSLFVLALACAAMPSVAPAAIVYELTGQVAGAHSAFGTITTDGTLGIITDANVVSSSITVTDAANSFLLMSAPFVFSDVTATATTLAFGGNGEVNFNNGSTQTHWRLKNDMRRTIRTAPSGGQSAPITYPTTFATGGVAVPEPGGALLIGVCMSYVALGRRRRNASC